jgi:hypothetical protein
MKHSGQRDWVLRDFAMISGSTIWNCMVHFGQYIRVCIFIIASKFALILPDFRRPHFLHVHAPGGIVRGMEPIQYGYDRIKDCHRGPQSTDR